ncbi:YybH family protein [Ulvibacterium sp.]|uniref:YybH family protein n=1 Tax=Ulvibacterium sp. TaxID=2665914 RepID=UPI003BAB5CCD
MKKNLNNFLLSLLISIPLLGISQSISDTDLQEAKKAIEESNAIYFTSFEKNDASIFIDRYAKDACIMLPNAPALCGVDAPKRFFEMAYGFGLRNGKFITQEIFGIDREFVAETGLWETYDSKNELMDNGKFLVLWKKTDQGWKIYRDSFNSNTPAN